MTKRAAAPDQRRSTLRRQFNQTFQSEDGSFCWSKSVSVMAQVILLPVAFWHFPALIREPSSLLIVFSVLIAPDVFKKALNLKYGSGNGHRSRYERGLP